MGYRLAGYSLGLALSLGLGAAQASAETPAPCNGLPHDLIDLHGAPASDKDRALSLFFDAGAWHGYALPARDDKQTGFVGPFRLAPENGRWAGKRVGVVRLTDARSKAPVALTANDTGGTSCPGRLERSAAGDGIRLRQTLFYAGAQRTLIRIEIVSDRKRRLDFAIEGSHEFADVVTRTPEGAVVATLSGGKATLGTRLLGQRATASTVEAGRHAIVTAIALKKQQPLTLFVEQVYAIEGDAPVDTAQAPEAAAAANAARWHGYLEHSGALAGDPGNRRVAAKAVQTLISNWRAPRGDLLHEGLFPSYSNAGFNGFWAWDSWKHAVALARFAPDLAKDQMRAMFDYQDAHGMVADVVYADKAENNWRDTKPPLAAWAVTEIHARTGDTAFVAEMFDKLIAYHRWWYANRDHDRDGLAEYGSTDGTRIAAAWESGMDNAVRFDAATMLKNGDGAWSLNQESVDLNAYLYAEKNTLAVLATAIGKPEIAASLKREADVLRTRIQQAMFDPQAGYFFDIGIADGKRIPVYGPEGWIPLWAGVATPDQAKRVVSVMLDPKHFATHLPFPTLDASHPQFSPIKGYWRGPVWLDQAWFAVKALENYGYTAEAREMRQRLLDNAVGLKGDAPIYENYDPLTGKGYQSPNFSWSAAHYLMLLWGDTAP